MASEPVNGALEAFRQGLSITEHAEVGRFETFSPAMQGAVLRVGQMRTDAALAQAKEDRDG